MASSEVPRPEWGFDFSDNERLYYRVTDERFMALLANERSTVHRIEPSYNSYGEFLFVTLSQAGGQTLQPVTFYSLGFHEYRERWIYQNWFWYQANANPAILRRKIAKEEAEEIIQQRRDEIAAYVSQSRQSERGRLFELLAELTDDDGAIAELDDLEALLGDFDGDEEET